MPITDIGDPVTVKTTFTVGGVPTNPTTVVLTIRAPDGTQTTPATTNPSVGVFQANVIPTQGGIWRAHWKGSGAVTAEEYDSFEVAYSPFTRGDLTSLEAVKASMETTSDATDALIQSTITSASRAIAEWSGREFVATGSETRRVEVRAYQERTADARSIYGIPIGDMATAPTAVVARDAEDVVITTYDVANDLVYLPLYRDAWEPITHIRLRPTAAELMASYVLAITGRFGFPQIPPDVAQACIVTVRSWLRRDSSAWADIGADDPRMVSPAPPGGWMLPTAAKQLLRSYRTPVLA